MKNGAALTEFKYGNGKKAYLSAIIDVTDGSIVSYVIIVFDTVNTAIRTLKEGEQPLNHSDRGYQYTSNGFSGPSMKQR